MGILNRLNALERQLVGRSAGVLTVYEDGSGYSDTSPFGPAGNPPGKRYSAAELDALTGQGYTVVRIVYDRNWKGE